MGEWRKSTYSGANGGDCVEVASDDAIMVRDTAERGGPVLTFTSDSWRTFTETIGRGRQQRDRRRDQQ